MLLLTSLQFNIHQSLRTIVPRSSFQHLCVNTKNIGDKITVCCQSAASWSKSQRCQLLLQAAGSLQAPGPTFHSRPTKVQFGVSALHSEMPVPFLLGGDLHGNPGVKQ